MRSWELQWNYFRSLRDVSEQSAKMIQQAVAGFEEGYYEQISANRY